MRFRIAFLGLLSFIAASCTIEEIFTPKDDYADSAVEFYATIDEQPYSGTKVYADDQLRVLWNEDDRMSIFNKNTFNQEYRFLGDDGDNAGAIVRVDDTAGSGDPLEHIYAVYPYVESTAIDASGTLSFTLPSEQSYHEKSFGIGANTMVSVTDDIKLRFKNIGGYLSLKFYGEGVSVSSIVLKGNNGELLSGPCSIVTSSGIPTVTMSSGASDQVTLVCNPPVELGSTSSDAVQFIFVLPPVTLAEGFTVTVTTPEGAVFEKSSSNKYEIGRSAITKLGAMKVVPVNIDYIKFADPEFRRICVENWDTDRDGELSYAEAASVTSLEATTALTKAGGGESVFTGSSISSANELAFFTGLTEITDHAFENCLSLKSIAFPSSVRSIGDYVFGGCSALIRVILKSFVPPSVMDSFFNDLVNVTIVVPGGAIDTYVSQWPDVSESIQSETDVPEANNVIYYTSSDGNIVTPYYQSQSVFGANIVSNEYIDGQGILTFDSDVTRIGPGAFGHCHTLTSITIPGSVSDIDGALFDYSENLITITVSSENETYDSRNDCNAIIHTASNTLVAGCKGTIIPNSVTEIGWCAFYACTDLTLIVIPESVTIIGGSAFGLCRNLQSITIPGSVTEIGAQAFSSSGLKSVVIPDSVKNIEDRAFMQCENLSSINVSSGNPFYDSRDNCNAIIETSSNTIISSCITSVIPPSVTKIGDYAFAWSYLSSIDIPNSVKTIGNNAFCCADINSLTIPSTVIEIGFSAFDSCDKLTSVIISSSITTIRNNTFGHCTSLESVFIPSSVTLIEGNAFQNSGIKSITIPSSVTEIQTNAFSECSNLESFTFPESIQVIGGHVLRNCTSLSSITLLGITPPYGDDVFYDTNDCPIYVPAESVEIYKSTWAMYSDRIMPAGAVIPDDPGSIIVFKDENARMTCVENWDMNGDGELSYAEAAAVSSIGQIFNGSDFLSFEEFRYFTGLVRLDDGAFAKSRIMNITLPDSLREIGDCAFSECDNLSGIVFPSSVEFFGSNIFDSTRYLQSVYIMAENPPTLEDARLYYDIDCVVFVPDDSLDRYLNNNDWFMHHTILPISSVDPSYGYRTDYGMVDRDEWED